MMCLEGSNIVVMWCKCILLDIYWTAKPSQIKILPSFYTVVFIHSSWVFLKLQSWSQAQFSSIHNNP